MWCNSLPGILERHCQFTAVRGEKTDDVGNVEVLGIAIGEDLWLGRWLGRGVTQGRGEYDAILYRESEA